MKKLDASDSKKATKTVPSKSEPQKEAAQPTVEARPTTPVPEKPIVHDISVEDSSPKHNMSDDLPMKNVAIIFVIVIIVGVLSGLGFSYATAGSATGGTSESGDVTLSEGDDVLETAGIADKDTFKDNAEGTLEEKTKDDPDEGSFKLIRPGGDSQTVYLTSSTVDMSEFIGKEVRVYGETHTAEEVGWLMDVGFIEVTK